MSDVRVGQECYEDPREETAFVEFKLYYAVRRAVSLQQQLFTDHFNGPDRAIGSGVCPDNNLQIKRPLTWTMARRFQHEIIKVRFEGES